MASSASDLVGPHGGKKLEQGMMLSIENGGVFHVKQCTGGSFFPRR